MCLYGKGYFAVFIIPLLVHEKVIPMTTKWLKLYAAILFSLIILITFSAYKEEHSEVTFVEVVETFKFFIKRNSKRYFNFTTQNSMLIGIVLSIQFLIPFVMAKMYYSRQNRGLISLKISDIVGLPTYIPSFQLGTRENWYTDTSIFFEHLPPNLDGASPFRGVLCNIDYYPNIVDKVIPLRYANEATTGLLRYIGGDVQNVITQAELPYSAFDPILLLHTEMYIHQAILTARYANESNNSHTGQIGGRANPW